MHSNGGLVVAIGHLHDELEYYFCTIRCIIWILSCSPWTLSQKIAWISSITSDSEQAQEELSNHGQVVAIECLEVNEGVNAWRHECTHERTHTCSYEWVSEWMNEWVSEWAVASSAVDLLVLVGHAALAGARGLAPFRVPPRRDMTPFPKHNYSTNLQCNSSAWFSLFSFVDKKEIW